MKYLLASLMGLTGLVASGCQTSTQSTCGTSQNNCGTGRCFTICLPSRESSCRKSPNLFGSCGSGSCNQKCESNCNTDNNACCPPTPTLVQRWQEKLSRPRCQPTCTQACENNCPRTPTLRDQWRTCSDSCNCESCQCGHQRRLFGYNRCGKGSCGTSCSKCEQPVCQPCQPMSTPCHPAPSKPVYCNSCERTPIIVHQPGTGTLPPIATSVPSREVAKAQIDDTPVNNAEVSHETRTIVGSLRYDAKANVWHLRHVGQGNDDQKVSEVTLKGIEPYVNSLRDRMTVSIRGELTTGGTSSQSATFTVSEVNIVGQ